MSGTRPRKSLLSRLARPFAALGRLVGRADEADADAPSPADDKTRHNVVEDSFTLALDDMLSEDAGRFQAKLQVISLVEFREAVGEKWSRLSEKVLLIAEGVINLHLGAGNVYGRQGRDCFVLLFRTVPHAEGRRRAVQIAQELGTRLVGAQFVGHDAPLALAAEIDLASALGLDGRLDLGAIDDAVGEMRAIIAPAAKPRTAYRPHLTQPQVNADEPIRHSPLPEPLPEQQDLRAHLRPSRLSAKDFAPRRSMLPSKPAEKAEATPRRVADPTWTAVEMAGDAKASPATLAETPPMPGDAALSLAWRPTWMAEGEVIGAYQAQIQRLDAPDHAPYLGCRAYPPGGGESAPTLDRFAIGNATREMRSSPAAAIVPLHWGSVTSPHRLGLMAPFADLSEEIRASRLFIELFGIPDGAPDAQLASVVQALRPLCRTVMLRTRLSHPRAPRAADCGFGLIGIDLAELPEAERTDDDPLLQALTALVRDAGTAGLGAYAWGIRRRKVVVGTVQGGFAMINGPGLMKDLARPAKVLPAPKSRLAG
ncbi:hypothetical protein [Magnetospirillum sp. SS-4]|uniref:hypothetical protein n=1 Tax=Magnetospirillum sp. SS-4 TaxID=2681465 RepID=UPI00137E4B6B|nr:hypothetical protein [Magnetospirillum sp. SS-4]CAA7625188.1 conserved hypothetical protein [Magnetospirillum sp. SS-4]